jgi:glycerol-3-phosphate acyltransferase PlsX
MRIAIDAMGGDLAPTEIVAGALEAAQLWPDTEFVLVGDETAVAAELGAAARRVNLRLVHAPDQIEMDDDPARAVRRKPQSSLVRACALVASGEADAVFSAGNTGAVAAAALLGLGRIPGVSRPCVAVVLPAQGGKVIVCDAGACVDSKPEWVAQFGIMASLYAADVEAIANPRVGLLNIGEEACKGNALTKAAHEQLANAGLNWVGNVEGKAAFRGVADVIACDGFDGNLLLKVGEGVAEFIGQQFKQALTADWLAKLGGLLARHSLSAIKRRLDYAEYGGAFLLGVKGLVVIGHGCSTRRAVVSALRKTREGIEHGLVRRLAQRFADSDEAAA